MSYLVDGDDLIQVSIFIDTESGVVIPHSCYLKQGVQPCRGDLSEPCKGEFAYCNDPNKASCTDLIGKMLKEGNNQLPERIKEEISKWKRPNWRLEKLIEKRSYYRDQKGLQQIDDLVWTENRIRHLLKEWTLSETCSELELRLADIREPGLEGETMIHNDSWAIINKNLRPEIINAMYRAYLKEVREDIPLNFTNAASDTSEAKSTKESEENSEADGSTSTTTADSSGTPLESTKPS